LTLWGFVFGCLLCAKIFVRFRGFSLPQFYDRGVNTAAPDDEFQIIC
jgi:hypothetical protein